MCIYCKIMPFNVTKDIFDNCVQIYFAPFQKKNSLSFVQIGSLVKTVWNLSKFAQINELWNKAGKKTKFLQNAYLHFAVSSERHWMPQSPRPPDTQQEKKSKADNLFVLLW